LWQTFDYDWLGNSSKTDDDARGFYDRSLGTVTNDTANDKPYQLVSASNESLGGTRTGTTAAKYDAAGNLTRLDVERNGTCLGGQCSQRFDYRWDEVGRLTRARRWDVAGSSLTTPDAALPDDSEVDADLEYVYDENDDRVLKAARDGSAAAHTAYIFDTLELRRTAFQSDEYAQSVGSGAELTETEVPYLFGHGVRLARVVYEQSNDGEPRLASSGRQHVFFELGDHLGSTSVVIDKATSELVERGAFQAYGAKESDYRPDRWKGFREDYGFTGKEEDVEVGLTYFGKRFLSPYLGRWVSADPLGVHVPGEADLNLYAYVQGHALRAIDPIGLAEDAPIGVKVTPEQQKAMGVGEGSYFFIDPSAERGVHKFDNLDSIKASAAKRGVPIFRVDASASTTLNEAKDFAEMMASIRNLLGGSAGGDGPGGECTGPACGTATDDQGGAGGPTDVADALALAGGIAADETDLVEGGSDAGTPGGRCETCPGSKAQQLAIGAGRVAQLAAGAKGTQVAAKRWRPGPNDVDWRGTGKGVREALDEAFKRTGVSRKDVTKWGKDAHGKSFPVEWRSKGGGEVNIDLGHATDGPDVPHVGYQTPGKRSAGSARGHILLDKVPVNR
jgi:RHS repeat-associated protein